MKCKLIIQSETNIKFEDVDVATRKRMVNSLKFFIPKARHSDAYKFGRWDGTVSYCSLGGSSHLNLLDTLLPIVQKSGYDIEIVDQRIPFHADLQRVDSNFFSHINWPAGHRLAGQPIIFEDHQTRTINNCVDNTQSMQEVATGAGKTVITAALSTIVGEHGRTIVIVPSKDLVTQTEADYKLVGLDVGVFYGDRKELNHQHTICTWQSLNVLDKKSKGGGKAKRGQQELSEPEIIQFLDGVIGIIVDEAHCVTADVLFNLLTGPFSHIPIRWGLTGTIPKEKYDFYALLSAIGPVVGSVTSKELQEKGFLADSHVDIIQMIETVGFNDWKDELKFLTTDNVRIQYVAELIKTITETHGNTLILVDRLETGKRLVECLPGSIFISGQVKSKNRKETYEEINITDEKIVIATYGVAAVGISINRLFNLVLFEPGKSFVRTVQSIGRGLRKAVDKNHINIWDICATTKYSKKHLTERKKFYKDGGHEFEIHKVDYQNLIK